MKTQLTSKRVYDEAVVTARTQIWQEISSGKCGSASIAIMDQGEIAYSEGFGMADRERSIPVDANTLFNVASISKVFAATCVMLLVDRGSVELDRAVTTYIPDFVMADARYKDITLRMLLNHTSGLPGTTGANNGGFSINPDMQKDSLHNLALSHLRHRPGDFAIYTNDGFDLATMIVGRVTGERYIDFLTKSVLAPLSLNRTGLSVGERSSERAAVYYDAATGKREPPQVISRIGAGGIGTTPEDLCRFADTFSGKGPQILSAGALAEMRKAQPSLFGSELRNPPVSFGLGWDMTDIPHFGSHGIKVMGKGGGNPNYSSFLLTAPDHRMSVAVTESGPVGSCARIASETLSALLAKKGFMVAGSLAASFPSTAQRIPAALLDFGGYYVGGFGQLFRVVFGEDRSSVAVCRVKNGSEKATARLLYAHDYLRNENGDCSYFAELAGKRFQVASFQGMDTIAMEKLENLDDAKELATRVDGVLWQRRNVRPYEGVAFAQSHLIKSSIYQSLPGYVEFSGVKRVESSQFAGMAGIPRDQTELTFFENVGQSWARVSDRIYSAAETAAAMQDGDNTVIIGSAGYSEWLVACKPAILRFAKPADARVWVFSADGSRVYDSAIDVGDVFVKGGSFVEFAGETGDKLSVTARFRGT